MRGEDWSDAATVDWNAMGPGDATFSTDAQSRPVVVFDHAGTWIVSITLSQSSGCGEGVITDVEWSVGDRARVVDEDVVAWQRMADVVLDGAVVATRRVGWSGEHFGARLHDPDCNYVIGSVGRR